jgi:hypothetical protein
MGLQRTAFVASPLLWLLGTCFLFTLPAFTSPSSATEYKYSTPIPPGVASPDTVETRFGTLHFLMASPTRQALRSSTTTWISNALCRLTCWPYPP